MKILSTCYFSTNFPEPPAKNISRENIIESLIATLHSNDVILLSGEQEIGKTTFLGEFCSKESANTISIFVKPINDFSTNLENIIYDLIQQLNFIINKTELETDFTPSIALLQQYLSKNK
jgi:ABC-type cobalamin/Fe3+-siderophores transport system ATPase subunit